MRPKLDLEAPSLQSSGFSRCKYVLWITLLWIITWQNEPWSGSTRARGCRDYKAAHTVGPACVLAVLTSLPDGRVRRTYLLVHTPLWCSSACPLVLYLATLSCNQLTYSLSAGDKHAGQRDRQRQHACLPQHNKYVSSSHVQYLCQLPTNCSSSSCSSSSSCESFQLLAQSIAETKDWDQSLIWTPIFGLSPKLRLTNFAECELINLFASIAVFVHFWIAEKGEWFSYSETWSLSD